MSNKKCDCCREAVGGWHNDNCVYLGQVLQGSTPSPAMNTASPTAPAVCEGCNGYGMVGNILDTDTCPFCAGSGEVTVLEGSGPDTYEMPVNCSPCAGTGAISKGSDPQPCDCMAQCPVCRAPGVDQGSAPDYSRCCDTPNLCSGARCCTLHDRPWECQGSATSDEAALEQAVDAEYPIPDSPHNSVLQRAAHNRLAFGRGYRAALAASAEQPATMDTTAHRAEHKYLYGEWTRWLPLRVTTDAEAEDFKDGRENIEWRRAAHIKATQGGKEGA